MLGISLAMLVGSALLMLRLSPGGSFPSPLSQEEEKKYLTQWQNGDISARNVLVEHNLRLVAHIIKKYYTQTNDIEDLISIGTIGLIKGINTYKSDKGIRLKKTMGDVSLSDVLDTDGEGNNLSLMDVLAQDDEMSEKIGDIELCGRLHGLVDSVLNEREARIIRLRYGLAGAAPMTQRETAKVCSISRSYVSRLEKKALEKLRSELGDDAYI